MAVAMHVRDIMQVLHQIPGKKVVRWKTATKSGSFHMEDEFVTSISVMRLAKIWSNQTVSMTVIELKDQHTSNFTF